MKKKISFLCLSLLTAALVVGCDGKGNSNQSASNSTSGAISNSTSTSSSASTSATVVHVESVELTAEKTKLVVGEDLQLGVTITPSTADNKDVTYSSSDREVLTVSDAGVVHAVKAGTATVTVTTADGNKTDSIEFTVDYERVRPTITINGEKTYTVAAGEDLALPTYSAKDYNNKDLTSVVEIEDFNDGKSINPDTNVFNSKIAGEHTISYWVFSLDTELEAEETITVNVTPATPEDYDVTGAEDIMALKTYGEFKENFAKGNAATLAKRTDTNNASHISATSDAIKGNSLIIDFNKTAGSATTQVFLNAFGDAFNRGVKTTYEVEFDFKVLTNNNNTGNCYLQLSWDNDPSGINYTFAGNAAQNEVKHFSTKFSEVTVPEVGNAWFSFFKLSGDANDCIIAIDNFHVRAKETAQTTLVRPTSEELESTGFTYDWKDKWCGIGSAETTIVSKMENQDAKAAMLADTEHFGENVMRLSNASDHIIDGLNTTNLVADKKLEVTFRYYNVSDGNLHIIMMGSSGNPTIDNNVTITDCGNGIKEVSFFYNIVAGTSGINIYNANNGNFEIYLGKLTARLVEKDVVPENQTPNGHEVGFTFSQATRAFDPMAGLEEVNPSETGLDFGGETPEKLSKMTFALTNDPNDKTIEWFRADSRLEVGQKYKAKLEYYIADDYVEGGIHLRMDMQFIQLDATVGWHNAEIDVVPDHGIDFVNWYVNNSFKGTVYFGTMTFTLVEIVK